MKEDASREDIVAPSASLKLHLPIIDSLRGLAALFVCLYHLVYTTTGYFTNEVVREVFSHGQLGVHVFFVISGIVIPLSMNRAKYRYGMWRLFLMKRIARIEPPYLVSIAVGLAYLRIRNLIPGTAQVNLFPDFETILLHIGYLVPFVEDAKWINNVYWTLAVEFQYYLALCLLFPLLSSTQSWKRFAAYTMFLVIPFVLKLPGAFLPVWMPLFMIGILYSLYLTDTVSAKEYLILTLVSLVVISYSMSLVVTLLAATVIAFVHYAPNARNRVTGYLGVISYSLYLLHEVTGSPVVNFMSHSFREPWQKPLVVVLGVVISFVAAHLLCRFVEIPSRNWASRIRFQQ